MADIQLLEQVQLLNAPKLMQFIVVDMQHPNTGAQLLNLLNLVVAEVAPLQTSRLQIDCLELVMAYVKQAKPR